MLLAYFGQNVAYYHDAIMPLHGFVYTRVIIFALNTLRIGSLFVTRQYPTPTKLPSALEEAEPGEKATSLSKQDDRAELYRFAYTVAVISAGLASLARCNDRSATIIYVVLLICIEHLSQWVYLKHHEMR